MRKWKNFALALICTLGAYSLLFHDLTLLPKNAVLSTTQDNLWQPIPVASQPQKDTLNHDH